MTVDSSNSAAVPEEWTALHDRLHRTLRQRHLLPKQQSVLVAVSGGQDSLCLLRLLLDLQPKWQWHLAIAHCNHRWRADSDANADYVRELAQTWQTSYYEVVADGVSQSEAAARQWRYQHLGQVAINGAFSYIVTGHTASDRAETLLYNLMRGSGADGLQSLTWVRELVDGIHLVRPLLDTTRTETGQFCRDRHLLVWDDATNHDWHYARNRIRQDLLPYLQRHFNPQVEQVLAQTAELLRADVDYLEATAAAVRSQSRGSANSARSANDNRLNRCVLQSVPLAIQRRVLRQWLQDLLPVAPNFAQIEKLIALISAPNRTQTDPFPGGAIARVEGEWIVFDLLGFNC